MIPGPVISIPIPQGLFPILIPIPGFSKIQDSDLNKPGFDSKSDSGIVYNSACNQVHRFKIVHEKNWYTLDTFILASKNFHTFWFTRLISYFSVSYLGFSPL